MPDHDTRIPDRLATKLEPEAGESLIDLRHGVRNVSRLRDQLVDLPDPPVFRIGQCAGIGQRGSCE
jgi:hypothetical protein